MCVDGTNGKAAYWQGVGFTVLIDLLNMLSNFGDLVMGSTVDSKG